MSDQVELTDPVEHSVGGISGHIARRTFHISMALIPWLWFEHGEAISKTINIGTAQFASAVVITLVIVEAARLKLGITVFGQRDYEAKQVSALAWGAFAIGITFLTIPDRPEFVYPLVLSLSFGDPFLGELRRRGLSSQQVFIGGSIFLALIWGGGWYLFETPLFLVPLMAPICVAAEWPRLRWIDDNATMMLIPLAVVLIIIPWL